MNVAVTLRAFREALGFTQEEVARFVGVTQPSWSRWESGVKEPRDPMSVIVVLEELLGLRDEVFDDMCELVEHRSALLDTPVVELRTYMTDADYHAAEPRAGELGLPATLHRTAAAMCAHLMLEEHGIGVHLVTG